MKPSKVIAAGVSSLVAVSSVLFFYRPVTVYGDIGELSGAVDYFTSLDSASVQALSPAGFAVAGAVFAVNQALSHPIEGVGPIDASSLTTFCGVYRKPVSSSVFDYKLGTVSVYSDAFNISDGEGMAFLASDDYDCVCRFYGTFTSARAQATPNGQSFMIGLSGIGGTGRLEFHNYKNSETAGTPSSYQAYSVFNVNTYSSPGSYYSMQDFALYSYQGNSRPDVIGYAKQVQLPEGVIDSNYPSILAHWVADNYPEYTYLFPDLPPDPIYPSEYVTGIPKDWTIENPPLPTAPSIDFGQGDFDFSKPSEYLEEVVNEAEALDFWWWITEKSLKRLSLFDYFLAFITLGVVMFALWRWGS